MCQLNFPVSARHTSRIHAIVRYTSKTNSWMIHVEGKHGMSAGVNNTAFVPPQQGWVALSYLSFLVAIPKDSITIRILRCDDNSVEPKLVLSTQ
jgi:hypothetical protein